MGCSHRPSHPGAHCSNFELSKFWRLRQMTAPTKSDPICSQAPSIVSSWFRAKLDLALALKKMGCSQPLFLYFCVFSIVQLVDKILLMSGFEPQISGVGSNRSTNWATTTPRSCTTLKFTFWRSLSGDWDWPLFSRVTKDNLFRLFKRTVTRKTNG